MANEDEALFRAIYRHTVVPHLKALVETLRSYIAIHRSPADHITEHVNNEERKVDVDLPDQRDTSSLHYQGIVNKLRQYADRCQVNLSRVRLSHDAYEEARALLARSTFEALYVPIATFRQNLERLEACASDLIEANENLKRSIVMYKDVLFMGLKVAYKQFDHIVNRDMYYGVFWAEFRDRQSRRLPFSESTIQAIQCAEQFYSIMALFGFDVNDNIELKYRRSRDGKNVNKDILTKCRNTLTILLTECGRLIFGYNDVTWSDRWQEGSSDSGIVAFDPISPFRSSPLSTTTEIACKCKTYATVAAGVTVHKHNGLIFYVQSGTGVVTFMAILEDCCTFYRRANQDDVSEAVEVLPRFDGNMAELPLVPTMCSAVPYDNFKIKEVEIYERMAIEENH